MAAVVSVLETVMKEGAYAAPVIAAKLTENKKWGSRDRSFIVETTQDIFQHFRLLASALGYAYTDPALNYWQIVAAWWLKQGEELPDWEEFGSIETDKVLQRLANPLSMADALSVPDWLYATGTSELGEQFETELQAMQTDAPLFIRVNTTKATVKAVQKALLKEEIEGAEVPEAPTALQLNKKRHLKNMPAFRDGWFEVQDAGSQLIAPYLDAEPGMLVVDACAGAGGKSLHLADMMRNTGHIYAFDITEVKLKNLRHRLQRAGFTNVQPEVINTGWVKQLHHQADRLLLDVPCSGLGVLRRNPDTKWKLTAADMDAIQQTQREILTNYHTMLKPGGKMVYATCSILPSEDEAQVQWFLAEHPEYSLVHQQYVWPSQTGFDGFYMALLQKGK